MKRLCAITGTSGYVGGCVKKYFAAHDWEILELTRQPVGGARVVPFQLGVEISPKVLAKADVLVHCAYDFQPLRWEEIRAVNVGGTQKLFQAVHTSGIERIVCLSSIAAFDSCRSLYGRAKLEIEKIALDYGALVIRPGLVYGNNPRGMFGKIVTQVRKSSVLPIFGSGSQVQFLVNEEDLTAFIEQFALGKINAAPGILTAAHEKPWPFRRLLSEIARGLDKKVKFFSLPWPLVWAGLKMAEACGLRLNFRSDSLVSLMHQNPNPDFSANRAAGLTCRLFQVEKLQL